MKNLDEQAKSNDLRSQFNVAAANPFGYSGGTGTSTNVPVLDESLRQDPVSPTNKPFNLIPLAGTKNKVFVQPIIEKEKISAGGLILINMDITKLQDGTTEVTEKRPTKGIVLAISEADENGIPPTLKVGDTVLFSEYSGKFAEFEGTDYLVMKENEIYAKLR